jgi:hypothetical protein
MALTIRDGISSPRPDAAESRDLVEDCLLNGMIRSLITFDRPALVTRKRQHGCVFARAVVVNPRGPGTGLIEQMRAPRRERLVRATGEITFLEADVREHLLDDIDVLGLAAMRCTRERELLISPTECVESSRFEEGDDLEWLGA